MYITIIATLITAIAAIFAPTLTAIINNNHQIKMANNELHIKHKIEIIEKYLYNVGKYVANFDPSCYEGFLEMRGIIFIHIPALYWEDLENLHTLVDAKDESAYNHLSYISQMLSYYLETITGDQISPQ